MAVFSLKQLLEAGGIFRISRTSDARPYGSDEVRMGTNLSVGFAASSPWEGEPMGVVVFIGIALWGRGANVNTRRYRRR